MNYRVILAGLLLSCAAVVGPSAAVGPPSAPPSAPPASRPDRGTSRLGVGALERARDAADLPAARAHGWAIWAELTASDARGMPRWIGWAGAGEVLGRTDAHFAGERPAASQPSARRGVARGGGARGAAGSATRQVVRRPEPAVSVYFNPDAAEHLRRNGYDARSTFAALRDDLDRAGAPPAARTIAPFPRDAIAVKAVWRIVRGAPKPGEVWVLPTWDPEVAEGADCGAAFPPSRWGRSVVIDLSGRDVRAGEAAEVNLPGQPRASRVVSINRFFHLALDARQAADLDASPGDTAILVGLHVATKELPTWVWATYWWHDRPDAGEFAAGRPAVASTGVWGNYLMNVDLGDPAGAGGRGGTARRAVFNPWLEAGLKGGTTSNCLSCHQQASLTSQLMASPFSPIRRTPLSDQDSVFRDRVRTDFIWSVAGAGAAEGGKR